MLKKFLLLSVSLFLVLTIAACGDNEGETNDPSDNNSVNEQSDNTADTPSDTANDNPDDTTSGVLDIGASGDVVASVNGEEISMEEFQNVFEQNKQPYVQQGIDLEAKENEKMLVQLQQGAIDQLVNTKLIVQAAEDQGYAPTKQEVEDKYAEATAQFKSEEKLNEALEQNNLTAELLKENLRQNLQINLFIEESTTEATVTEEEIEEYYNKAKQQQEQMPVKEGQQKQEMPPLEEIREKLVQTLKQQKQSQEIMNIIDTLKTESEIEIYI